MSYFRQLVPGGSNCRSLIWQLAPAAPETTRAPTCFLLNDPGQLKEGPTCRHGLCARSLMFLAGGGGTMKLSVENIKTQNSQPLLCYPIILRLMQWLGWVLAGKGSFALVFIKRTVA